METNAVDHEAIELYAAIDQLDKVVGRFPMLGLWGPDNFSTRCPFALRADRADFGFACDDPPDSIRFADCDLIWRRVVYGERVRWKEDSGSTIEYRIVSVEDVNLHEPPLDGMAGWSPEEIWPYDT